ncbi:hypothetical protein EGW08_004420, partial [Elysia chlorotica]
MGTYREKCAKMSSLIGIHFLVAPSSFLWNYGNLSAYMESFFHVYCNSSCVDGDSQFIPNLFVASICPGIYLSGPISSALGLKWTGVLSLAICNIGLISSTWTVQISVTATAFTMGFLNGVGMGMSLCVGFMYVSVWTDRHKGLFIATVTSAPTILSVAQNQIITAYVNPKNLKPDTEVGPRTFFSDVAMMKRVPVIILIYGVMTLGLQVIGTLLVMPPPSYPQKQNCTTKTIHTTSENISVDIAKGDSISKKPPRSYTPLEALRTRSFVALWFFVVALMYGMILKNNFYKQFGLTFIQNDMLLTLLGSLIPIVASIARITFGWLMDRDILSIRTCMVIILSANSLLCAFWWFAPQVGTVVYVVLVLGLASMQSVTYTLVAAGTLQIFGPHHFAGNFAMVYTAVTTIAIVSGLTVTPMLQSLGWFWLFASSSILSAVVVFLPL